MSTQQLVKAIQKLIAEGDGYHVQGRHALSLQSYQKAIELAASLGDRSLDAFLLAQAAMEHRDCDNYHYAVELLIQALTLVQNEDQLIGLRTEIKKLLAITLKDIFGPQKPEVLKLLQEAREDCIKIKDVRAEANLLLHIGSTYLETNELKEADRILTEALGKSYEVKNVQHQGWILITLADLEIERGEWGIAMEYNRNAREKVRKAHDTEAEGNTWVTEARILFRMGQLEEALTAAQTALSIYTQNKNQRRSIRARRHIAKILLELGRADEAYAALQEALKTARYLDLSMDQMLITIQLGWTEFDRRNFMEAQEFGTVVYDFAKENGYTELSADADDLLQRCYKEDKTRKQ